MNIRKQLFMHQCQATSLIHNKHGALLAISYTDTQREETGVPGPKKTKTKNKRRKKKTPTVNPVKFDHPHRQFPSVLVTICS